MQLAGILGMLLLATVYGQTVVKNTSSDCPSMPEDQCKSTGLCDWRRSQCRLSVYNCAEAAPSICNAADNCIYRDGQCIGVSCPYQGGSKSQCTSDPVCRWIAEEARCAARDTCYNLPDADTCRSMGSQGCSFTNGRCAVSDPCGSQSPTNCGLSASETGIKCAMYPGACYGQAMENLQARIDQGSNYSGSFVQEPNVLTANKHIE